MINKYIYLLVAVLFLSAASCKKSESDDPTPTTPSTPVTSNIKLTTDKAIYSPGNTVTISLEGSLPGSAKVRYRHLGEVVSESAVSGSSWTWQPPGSDYKGYLVEVYNVENGEEKILASIGVDVSSNWAKFPRYGFLSLFPNMTEAQTKAVIDNLNRYHINGLQFYDWHYKHHQPLAGTPENPEPKWRDIMNREVYFSTVENYIDQAHDRNMKAMFYNLIFGAWKDAETDGVSNEWYLYTDRNHQNKDKHPLPQPPFLSDIYLLNPANTSWQNYLVQENRKVYQALPFDGFHMDQLGNRNTSLYTYQGSEVDLAKTYKPLIEAVKADKPGYDLVMNAVNQYGQQGIAEASTSFLYTEVWGPNDTYADLARLIRENNAFSNNTKNTVLAAYMNYDLANNKGSFNTPAVLLTDAVIFAFGGSHLELGEHMLGKEYFPNNNLSMKGDLQKALPGYYDFMVAYQNLLRDGGTFNEPALSSIGQVRLSNWPANRGDVAVVGKEVGNKQIIHLINFTNANSLNWRDNSGTQPYPQAIQNVKLSLATSKAVKRVWVASPDFQQGVPQELTFTQNNGQVSFTLPYLQYWDMLVIE
ncbi:glycoside hydrolase family 66 protein [Pontibacter sp. MBLB2868]|uniref:glycoside hydrolase family 66 protein n=1 Tax=Pontibacter sp. MBLB2868 TaxID=3451555 RepID=UPI003F74FD99